MVQYKTIILLTVIGLAILFSGCIGKQVARELPSGALYVDARMKKPVYWAPEKYELVSLQVQIFNQQESPLVVTAQIVNSGQVLEEQTFILERQGSSYSFTNQKTHFINNTNVTLRVLIQGYQPVEYAFMENS